MPDPTRLSIRAARLAFGCLVLGATAVLSAACSGSGDGGGDSPPPQPGPHHTGTATLKYFQGEAACSQLEAHIEDSVLAALRAQLENQRTGPIGGVGVPISETPQPSAPAGDAGSNYSGTTVRTAGVDEADPVKNDGERLFMLKDAADGIVLSRVDLAANGAMALGAQVRWTPAAEPAEREHAEGLYLVDPSRVVALTSRGQAMPYPSVPVAVSAASFICPADGYCGPSIPPSVRLRLVNADSPTLATDWDLKIEGSLRGSRRVADRIHLVTEAALVLPDGVRSYAPWNPDQSAGDRNAAINAQIEANTRLVLESELAWWLAPVGQQGAPTPAQCASFARIDAPSQLGFLRITTVDLATRTVTSQTVLAQANGMYLSGKSLVLLSAEWGRSSGAQTYLHRFVPEASGGFAYQGSGRIEGQLINDYAIDESDSGIVRVAAAARSASGQPYSYLATFEPAVAPDPWRQLGRSDPIAPGETLQSARFLGDRAYLVTFLQVDPFFVYDLSDPVRPAALGELKIPGFSTYLQPVGARHVLGIGYAEGGWPRRIKASLFDVTDPTSPLEQSSLALGDSYTDSDALWDPHAFTWYSPTPAVQGLPSGGTDGTFGIPVRSYGSGHYGTASSSGVRLVSVRPALGAAALSLNGTVSLDDLLGSQSSWHGWRQGDARRAVFVGSTAYAVADGAVRSAPITAPAQPIATLMIP